jgi:hypothetical protein
MNNTLKINCIGDAGNSVFKVDTVSGITSPLDIHFDNSSMTTGRLVVNEQLYARNQTGQLVEVMTLTESLWNQIGNDISYTDGTVSIGNLSAGDIRFSGQLLQNGLPITGSKWASLGQDISYTSGTVSATTMSISNGLNVMGPGQFTPINVGESGIVVSTTNGSYTNSFVAGYTTFTMGSRQFKFLDFRENWPDNQTFGEIVRFQSWNDGTTFINGRLGVGAATSTPVSQFHLSESTGTPAGANAGSIVVDHQNNGGASSIVFRSRTNRGSDYGFIQYQDATPIGGVGESARLIIGIQNDSDDHLLLSPSGNVGINNSFPIEKLDVTGNMKINSSNRSWRMQIDYDDGDARCFAFEYIAGPTNTAGYTGFGVKGYIDPFWNNVRMNFTGQHRCVLKNFDIRDIKTIVGLIVIASENDYISTPNNKNIQRGKGAIGISDALPIVTLSMISNDKRVFGVVSDVEDPESRVYETGSWCSPCDKELGDNRIFVNSVGEGGIWICDANGPLMSGDYITTSDICGYGMRQKETSLHNFTVAKITMDCDFTNPQRARLVIKRNMDGVAVLDNFGNMIWEDSGEWEDSYEMRHITYDGKILTREEYNTSTELCYRAAFVGCTYHCG